MIANVGRLEDSVADLILGVGGPLLDVRAGAVAEDGVDGLTYVGLAAVGRSYGREEPGGKGVAQQILGSDTIEAADVGSCLRVAV